MSRQPEHAPNPGVTWNTRPVRHEEYLMSDHPESCRSEDGITVGLVDALIGIMRVLAPRDLSATSVQEALADLLEDPDFRTVRHGWRLRPGYLGPDETVIEDPGTAVDMSPLIPPRENRATRRAKQRAARRNR